MDTLKTATYGDFLDLIKETKSGMAQSFLKTWWREAATEAEWKEARLVPLAVGLVMDFTDDAALFFQERLAGTCTEDMYDYIKQDYRAFLEEVREKAAKLGITVDLTKFLPLTPTEIIANCNKV